jgi:adenylate cyclase
VSVQPVERKLAAIFAADIAGYSRLMARDEVGTLAQLKACRAIIDGLIASHRGRIFNTAGDSVVADFASAVDALQCAVAVQEAVAAENAGRNADEPMEFRIGVHVGDVMVDGNNLLGDGVNIAARLESLAEPGAICISAGARDHIGNKLPLAFDDLGDQQVKNIAQAIRVYRVQASTPAAQPVAALPLPDKPSIAVLPFQNMSGDPEQEYFADGIAEDVITLLSKSRGLFVIARNSTFTYKGCAIDVKTVGRELGVRYVLEGSVRKAANRVRVTAQLIEAATSGHLWAEHYDRDLTDIFAVQDEITAAVSTAILPTMERSERERASRKPPDSLDAWECYHRGLWHFSKMEAGENTRAIGFFERGVELDPGFAAAHAALSLALVVQAATFRPQAERQTLLPRAGEQARRAIAMDPTTALAHSSLARVLMVTGRHEEAMAEADLAVSLDPNSALSHYCQGHARAFGGRPREALLPLEAAMRLSPFDPFTPFFLHVLGRAYYWMGDYPAAVATARQLCRSFPNFQNPYRTLIAALGQTGQASEAQVVMADALTRFGEDFRSLMGPLGPNPTEDRAEDREHLLEGYRKAGVLEE